MAGRQNVTTKNRDIDALALRTSGSSYEEIATQLGWKSRSAAVKAVRRALDRSLQPVADEYRALQMQRLDAMRRGIWPKVERGDARAVEVAVKIEEREAKLLGLDMPQQIVAASLVQSDVVIRFRNEQGQEISNPL